MWLQSRWRDHGRRVGQRYSFGRYFSPLEPSRPADLASLCADNDVVYDRSIDPDETTNPAADTSAGDLVASFNAELDTLAASSVRVWLATQSVRSSVTRSSSGWRACFL